MTLGIEKRQQRRFFVDAPLLVRSGGHSLQARLHDFSIGGIYFFSSAPVAPGLPIEIVLTMPREIGLSSDQEFCCRGATIRVHKEGHSRFGIAAQIDEYRSLAASSTIE